MDVIFVFYDFYLYLFGMYFYGNLFSFDKGRLVLRVSFFIVLILNVVKLVWKKKYIKIIKGCRVNIFFFYMVRFIIFCRKIL